jgi:hypothetical protein
MDRLCPSNDAAFGAQSTAYTTVAYTTGWQKGPRGVLVWTTSDAYVGVVSSTGTVTTANMPIPAGVPFVLDVPQDAVDGWRVGAVQISAGGTVYAKPIQA